MDYFCIRLILNSRKNFEKGLKTIMEMNATPSYLINTTDAHEDYEHFDKYVELRKSLHIMSLVIYSLTFILGVLGNGVVIWVAGFKMKKTVNTVWFLNLAVADFLFTALLPLSLTYLALDFHWPFGKFMCKLSSTMNSLNMFASVYILVVISMDRFVSVVWPVWAQNHRNVRRASFVCLGVWVFALIVNIPNFVFRDTAPAFVDEDTVSCFNNYALIDDFDDYDTVAVDRLRKLRHRAVSMTHFLLGFVVPFTVIVSCYSVIIYRLRRNSTLASQSGRAFKIIAAVIITFFLCWVPYHIMALINMVNYTATKQSPTLHHVTIAGIPITSSLAVINSCLNPLLYVFMGQDFKDKVRKSILNVLESAFQEDSSASQADTKSTDTSQSKDRSTTRV